MVKAILSAEICDGLPVRLRIPLCTWSCVRAGPQWPGTAGRRAEASAQCPRAHAGRARRGLYFLLCLQSPRSEECAPAQTWHPAFTGLWG